MDERSADEPSARESFDEERERLRRLLVEKGFLTASHTARLFSRSGRSMSWMLYTPAITMTSEGSWLAGRCLLRRLEQFKGSQLATYGYTGLPLMIASLTLANGRYRGLVVGDKPNSDEHGVVEGDGSRPGPVVVIDDSLVSGTSFFRAARLLEEDGFQVEGLICLVEFPGRGGRAFAEAAGYRVEAVYELDRDLEISRLEAITSGFSFQSASTQSASTLAPGPPMDPVVAARRVAEAWPNSDRVAEEASCPHGQAIHSGAVVEFRDGKTGRLVARDGVVSPSGPAISCTAAAAATVKAIMRRSGSQLQSYGLDGIRISVKLLTQAEEIAPREIDAARYALVVQSQMNPARVGYALRDDRRRTEIALYLAAQQMAGLGTAEPHTIYRCLEQEMAEPGVSHITSRRAVDLEVSAIAALAGLARATISGIPDTVSDGLVAGMDLENLDIHGAGVGWYEEGRLLGCWLSWGSSLAIAVRRAAARAWQLCGRTQPTASEARDLKVLITLLHEPRHLGELSAQAAAEAFDLGEETLVASAGDHSAAVFPHFMCHHGWSGRQTADLALRKAGIRGPSAMWSAYRTTSWLDGQGLQFPIEHGFPIRPAGPVTNDRFGRSARAVADFIARHVDSNGLPVYQYDPLTDSVVRDGPIGRIIFALDALAEAASVLGNDEWAAIARNGLQVCVDQLTTAHQGVSLEAKGRPK
ncbi:MAG TPA: AMMECR1 domain-containing protein, partial [Silvibacterium sp.]|nr:AMMECR1 domain-containing protein [Silvibacterium sp.]